ncbi:hypothetical protein Noda2021_03270 [Candidatus Dependentiae bacterium Noda2021]|nr:hypothetical protein Noda2021_03270 [Candidatus Dependentiae bacterium Noda2021]
MNQDGLYDIYGSWHTPWWQTTFFWYAAVCTAILLLFVILFSIIYWYVQKKRVLLPWDKAQSKLNELKIQSVHQSAKKSYSALIQTIKTYCLERFKLPLALTEFELEKELARLEISPTIKTSLIELFNHATQAKYAHQCPLLEVIQEDIENALTFIRVTTPTSARVESL